MPNIDIDEAIGEYEIPGEAEIIGQYVNLFDAHFRKYYDGQSGVAQRAIHAKSHACLRASLEIFDHGDAALQHSIFSAPKTYEAIVRVSNGDGPPGPDNYKPVSIGFAIKVRGVEAEKFLAEQTENSQDFLFCNQPAYIAKDVRAYKWLVRAIDGGPLVKGFAVLRNLRGILYRLQASPKDDPLNTFFWGVAPFRLGDIAVKYLIRPSQFLPVDKKELRKKASADYLTAFVRQHIESKAADYDFYLQKRVLDGNEARAMPIENYRVAWDESKSVPVHVGRLRIAQQKVEDPFDHEGEHMVFSPWNTTKDFRPLGSLNRARRIVYSYSSRRRHEINKHANPFA
jgi:hypothetical protein